MFQKRTLAAVLAAGLMMGCAMGAGAEENSTETTAQDYSQAEVTQDYDVTAVTVTTAPPADYDPRQSAGNAVTQTWATTTTHKPDKLVAPAKVYTKAGEVKDGKVKVDLIIESDSLIANAALSVSFDSTVLEYQDFKPNKDAGGMVVENAFSDRFVFNYVNEEGSDHDGSYCTLTFKLVDSSAKSAVVYVNVNSLDDEDMESIPYSTENAIIQIAAEETGEDEVSYEGLPVIEMPYRDEPVDPAELGLSKVKYMVIEDDDIVQFTDGMLVALAQGETRIEITYSDDKQERIVLKITEPQEDSSEDAIEAIAPAEDSADKKDVPEEEAPAEKDRKTLFIMLAVAAAVIALIVEYIVIMKPFGGKKKRHKKGERYEDEGPEDPDDKSEMLAELEKAIAAKNTRENERRMEEGIASTAQINSVLVEKGFKITDDDDDDIDD